MTFRKEPIKAASWSKDEFNTVARPQPRRNKLVKSQLSQVTTSTVVAARILSLIKKSKVVTEPYAQTSSATIIVSIYTNPFYRRQPALEKFALKQRTLQVCSPQLDPLRE